MTQETKLVTIVIPDGKTVKEKTLLLATDEDTGKQLLIVGYKLND